LVKEIRINKTHLDLNAIQNAADTIKEGGLVVYPTETCYGLGANALDYFSVKKVFQAKGRSPKNPIHIIVNSFETAKKYGVFSKEAERIASHFWPGPLTIAVNKKDTIPDILNPDRIAIRIPAHNVCTTLMEMAATPITATSANRSGDPAPYSISEVKNSLGSVMDLILDSGRLPQSPPSTIIDFVMEPSPQITREGAISIKLIFEILGIEKRKWHKHTLNL